jgi:hypothetical protein
MRIFVSVLMILIVVNAPPAFAKTRQMECREWLDGKYRGVYMIVFDLQTKSLSIAHQPEGQNFLFGRKVNRWQLIWEKENNVVFYGTDLEDWAGPVKIISLDFGEARMFDYSIGGAIEGDIALSKLERHCHRLD